VLSLVDRLLLFEKGRLLADGPRDSVLAILQGGPKAVQPGPTAAPNPVQPRPAQPVSGIAAVQVGTRPGAAPSILTSTGKTNAAV
jgi:hypothetical protein